MGLPRRRLIAAGAGQTVVTWDEATSSAKWVIHPGGLIIHDSDPNGANWECAKASAAGVAKAAFSVVTAGAGSNTLFVGLAPSTQDCSGVNDTFCGKVANSVGYLGVTGEIYINQVVIATGPTWTIGDEIGVHYNASTGDGWFLVNGVPILGGNPATGANPSFTGLSGLQYPSIASLNNNTSEWTGHFSLLDMPFPPAAGFTSWGL
jgi:hypothetical protein